MRIMVDSDLVLESLLNRSQFIESSKSLWRVIENKEYQGYISSSGLAKITDIVRDYKNEQIANSVANTIQKIFSICSIDQSTWDYARSLNIQDFESAMEIACARQMCLSALITQIPENFPTNQIPIYTIDNLLKERSYEKHFKHHEQNIQQLESLLSIENCKLNSPWNINIGEKQTYFEENNKVVYFIMDLSGSMGDII